MTFPQRGRENTNLSSINTRTAEGIFRDICATSYLRSVNFTVIAAEYINKKCLGGF